MNNFDLTKFLAEGKLHEVAPFELDAETKSNLQHLTKFRGDEKVERLTGLVNHILSGDSTKFELDDETKSNLKHLTNFKGDEKIEKLTGLANYILDTPDFKFVSESLNEAMSPQDIVDIADTVAEEFTKEDADGGIFMVYSVGKMDVDDMTFELDTDTTSQTPERILNMSNLGVGEGWGGSFRIKPKGEGYEVRNTEKGGLVAIIDNMGSFKMISNDEAKAEMGRTKGEETDFMQNRKEMDDYAMDENKEIKSNKMKKSELKEMIKAAMMADTAVYEAEDVEVTDDEDIDVDIEKDVKVDDEESEVDIDINAELPGEDGDVTEVLALLMKSQQAAEDIGDEKLMDQIGNTITYFTRSHVANVNEADLDMDLDSAAGRAKEATIGLDETEELDEKKQGYNDELDDSEGAKHGKKKQDMAQRRADSENMEKADGKRKYSGDKSKDLNESVTFPMWNKIK